MSAFDIQADAARVKICRMLDGVTRMNNFTESCKMTLKKCRSKIDDPIFNESEALMKSISAKIETLYSIAKNEAEKRGAGIDIIKKIEQEGAGEISRK